MPDTLVPRRFLFRFSVPCLYREALWGKNGLKLEEQFALPSFAELEQRAAPADVRAAWNESGLAFSVSASGKQQPPWCRASKPDDSDGVQLLIDTRDVHNIHRAGRFCHRFVFLPGGAGKSYAQPVAEWLPINRARENPNKIDPKQLKVRSRKRAGGYLLEAFVPAEVLTGFDPEEHPRLGFNYAVLDRELGEQTLTAGSPMPFLEDPSLWATLELVR